MNSIETKKPYEKPEIEVIEIATEAPLLVASDPKQYGKKQADYLFHCALPPIFSSIGSIWESPKKNTIAAAITQKAVTPQYRYFLCQRYFIFPFQLLCHSIESSSLVMVSS